MGLTSAHAETYRRDENGVESQPIPPPRRRLVAPGYANATSLTFPALEVTFHCF
jgi:hypothetical protein